MNDLTCSIEGCGRKPVGRGWCGKHYQRWRTHGSPTGGTTERCRLPLAERFWTWVDKRDPDECWEWQGSRNKQHYGRVMANGRVQLAHRLAYELAHGAVPEQLILHACDNPPCVNPAHLFPGSQADNVRDMIAKGRYWRDRSDQKEAIS